MCHINMLSPKLRICPVSLANKSHGLQNHSWFLFAVLCYLVLWKMTVCWVVVAFFFAVIKIPLKLCPEDIKEFAACVCPRTSFIQNKFKLNLNTVITLQLLKWILFWATLFFFTFSYSFQVYLDFFNNHLNFLQNSVPYPPLALKCINHAPVLMLFLIISPNCVNMLPIVGIFNCQNLWAVMYRVGRSEGNKKNSADLIGKWRLNHFIEIWM